MNTPKPLDADDRHDMLALVESARRALARQLTEVRISRSLSDDDDAPDAVAFEVRADERRRYMDLAIRALDSLEALQVHLEPGPVTP